MNALTLAVLAAVCDGIPTTPGKDGPASCTACPAYTASPGREPGFSLARVYYGSFSGRGADQALAVLSGCGGGTALLEQDGEVWRREDFFPGFSPSECVRLEGRSQTHSLACGVFDGKSFRFEIERFLAGRRVPQRLLERKDKPGPAGSSCVAAVAEDPQRDAASPGRAFSLTVQAARSVRAPDGSCEPPANAKTYRVRFLYDGRRARPDLDSLEEFRALDALLSP